MTSNSQFIGKLIVVEGPTSAGKTNIAIKLATHFVAEIISADSRQFYKEIPIGTAAPSAKELSKTKHHFIANLCVTDDYNIYQFEHDVLNLLNTNLTEAPIVIMVGGSGLYIDAVCNGIDIMPKVDKNIRKKIIDTFSQNGIEALQQKLMVLDPKYYRQVDINNPKRLMRAIEICLQTGKTYSELRKNKPQKRSFDIIKIGISVPRNILIKRINTRVDTMVEAGFVNEAKSVYQHKHHNSLNTVGYKELFAYFDGNITLTDAIEKIKTNTRRYAKRQMTWFRKDKDIHWFDYDDTSKMIDFIER